MRKQGYSVVAAAGAVGAALSTIVLSTGFVALSTQPAWSAEKLLMAVNRPSSAAYAPWAMAIQLGYFKEEGIDFDMVTIRGGPAQVPQLARKKITVGHVDPETMILTQQPGRDKPPLKFFYNHFRRSVYQLIVPEKSSIQKLSDLKGKKIGITNMEAAPSKILDAAFRDYKIGTAKDVEFTIVTSGGAAIRPFMKGKVDAMYNVVPINTIPPARGFPVREISLRKYDDVVGHGLLVHEDTLRTKRKLLIGFGRATAKGTVACHVDPAKCTRMYWRTWPDLKSKRGNEKSRLKRGISVINAYKKRLTPPGSAKWGEYNEDHLKLAARVLHTARRIKTTNINYNNIYTNALIGEINNFDTAAVIRAAKALK
jgi:NitT/TauT family transport system substrate-binding protein